VRDARQADEVEEQPIAERQRLVRHVAAVDVVHGIAELLLERLAGIVAAELPIFVDRARDDADVKALGALGLAVDVERETRLASVPQPLLEAESVALGFRDLLAVLVEE